MIINSLDCNIPWREQMVLGEKPIPSVCVVRYGAVGDMIQASSVFPLLKSQGHHLCVNTTQKGYNIIRNDPYVDEVLLQEDDYVPNEELGAYWKVLSKRFTKFINLTESVERTLLVTHVDKVFHWSKEKRHFMLNKNYMEFIHTIAGVPFVFNGRFYPSETEAKWALKERNGLGRSNKVIMIVLAGSSVHKAWPHADRFMMKMLVDDKSIRIVLVGDELCKVLEYGWGREKRVIKRSGEWSIRKTLAFAEYCDLVIGPETGVLNAVAQLHVPKILLLSHSTIENIGKEWKNTKVIGPTCECYPCHQLHYGFETCKRDKFTGGSLCAASIDPEVVYESAYRMLNRRNNEHISGIMSKVA